MTSFFELNRHDSEAIDQFHEDGLARVPSRASARLGYSTSLRRNPSVSSVNPRRTLHRSNTIKNISSDYQAPGDLPGGEPGVSPHATNVRGANLHTKCQITLVDFSLEDVEVRDMFNEEFLEFIEKPRPAWAKVRWINVNGLSWDVISAIGKKWGLHRLGKFSWLGRRWRR